MMSLIFQEIKNENEFNPLQVNQNAPFTQAYFYGEWQKGLERKTRRFVIKDDSEPSAFAQVIKYPLIFGKSYLYIPYGPVVKSLSTDLLNLLKEKLQKILKEENAVFARIDFTPPINGEIQNNLLGKFFRKAPLYTHHSAYFQPRREWILDLEPSEEKLLTGINKKNRYCIRLAEKSGVKVEIIDRDFKKYFEDFYFLMEETAQRDKFHLHPKNYYESVFESCEKYKNAYLAVAKYKDETLVIALMIVYGNTAYWVFGGSSSAHRDLASSHLVQWQSIRHAKKIGLKTYNFGAITDNDKIYGDWKGITLFKKRFGGQTLQHSDFYDLIAEPLWYNLYNLRKFIKKII